MLEYRKVQKNKSGDTYFLNLPAEWTRKQGITKKDVLIVQEAADGSLRIEKVKL